MDFTSSRMLGQIYAFSSSVEKGVDLSREYLWGSLALPCGTSYGYLSHSDKELDGRVLLRHCSLIKAENTPCVALSILTYLGVIFGTC